MFAQKLGNRLFLITLVFLSAMSHCSSDVASFYRSQIAACQRELTSIDRDLKLLTFNSAKRNEQSEKLLMFCFATNLMIFGGPYVLPPVINGISEFGGRLRREYRLGRCRTLYIGTLERDAFEERELAALDLPDHLKQHAILPLLHRNGPGYNPRRTAALLRGDVPAEELSTF